MNPLAHWLLLVILDCEARTVWKVIVPVSLVRYLVIFDEKSALTVFFAILVRADVSPTDIWEKLSFSVFDAVSKLAYIPSFFVFQLPFPMWFTIFIKMTNVNIVFPGQFALWPSASQICSLVCVLISLLLSDTINVATIQISLKFESCSRILKISLDSTISVISLKNVSIFENYTSSSVL